MTFRVYLRGPDQSVSNKTNTGDPESARAAFKTLVGRTDLDGTQMLAVLNKGGKPVAHHRFDGHDPAKQWRGRTDDIVLSKAG